MKGKEEILEGLLTEKLVAVVRLNHQAFVQPVLESLVAGGIKILEITTNTPGFRTEIKNARLRYPDILIGAGTVINKHLAEHAIASGAQFLVTPNTNKEIAEIAFNANIPILMGALTPTEISDALSFGADIIKLFPAGQFGISYLNALRGPFKNVKIFAVGGIGLDTLAEWVQAGIDGLGIGSSLVKASASTAEDMKEIEDLAKQFINGLRQGEHIF
jgi:2-dehydro-3-deoxyphosphogluconate aldolase/(4S)-4-hydroxy-2-oxoglutarate aldolase